MNFREVLEKVHGIKLAVNPHLPTERAERVQVRFPRSKKKRIRKKWAKKDINCITKLVDCSCDAYRIGDTYWIHPKGFEKLKHQLASRFIQRAAGLAGVKYREKEF